MKDLKTILERNNDSGCALPEWCDVVKISPNNYDGTIEFMAIKEIKKDSKLSKVLKLEPWESIVIDEDIYVMIIDPSALDEK